jgi:hypothetical protein
MSWHSGYQLSGNEHSVYTAAITGFQIGIRRGAMSFQLRGGFIEENENLEKSQKLKGQSNKFKNL